MFRICKIITETLESTNKLKEFLGGYPVEITQSFPEEDFYDVPTLVVGWNTVKNIYPNQKINNKDIVSNLSWTYNESECKELLSKEPFFKVVEAFVNKNIYEWLPSEYIMYDSIVHGEFSKFINTNIDKSELTYVHFNKGALYMRNKDNDFIINAKTLWFTESNYRETVTDVLNDLNCLVYSYDKIEEYVNIDRLANIKALDIIRWVKYGIETPLKYFQIIPNVDVSKYVPFMMSMVPIESLELDEEEEVFFERMCAKDKITRWMSTRYVSFSYDFNKNLDFIYRDNAKLAKVNYSTKRTLTGRITSKDRYNPQNLSKDNEDRTKIISRFRNGRIYQFDYTSFEARIAVYLSGNEEFIQDYYDKDLHSETAIIIFETHNFTAEQRNVAKLANMAIMYGASEATAMKLLGKYPEPAEKLRRIKMFLEPVFKKAKEIIEETKQNGQLINKWGSIIKPEKDFAGFNNYLQSTASEIVVDKCCEIKELLRPYRSQFLFQVHDSLVFDVHPEEVEIVDLIAKTMSYNRGMIFTVVYKSGPNYRDLSSEYVYF
jgi:hypothetical protein